VNDLFIIIAICYFISRDVTESPSYFLKLHLKFYIKKKLWGNNIVIIFLRLTFTFDPFKSDLEGFLFLNIFILIFFIKKYYKIIVVLGLIIFLNLRFWSCGDTVLSRLWRLIIWEIYFRRLRPFSSTVISCTIWHIFFQILFIYVFLEFRFSGLEFLSLTLLIIFRGVFKRSSTIFNFSAYFSRSIIAISHHFLLVISFSCGIYP
jgi:hypothetical protein